MNVVGSLMNSVLYSRLFHLNVAFLLCLWSFSGNAAITQDPLIEQKLEQYLLIGDTDEAAATAFLVDVEKDINALTALHSRVRFYVYKASEHSRAKDIKAADQILAMLLELAQNSQDADVQAEVYAEHLAQYWARADIPKAISYLEPTLNYARQASQSRVRYYAFNIVARFQNWQGKYNDALDSFHQAYNAIEQDENVRTPIRLMNLASNIAFLQSNLKNFSKARQMIEQSLSKAANNPDLEVFLPDIYIQLGFILVELKELEKAVEANKQALKWAKKRKNKYAESTALNNLGDIAMRQRQLNEASQYFEQSLALGILLKDKSIENLAYFNLGYVQVLDGQHSTGIPMMQAAITEFKKSGPQSEVLDYLAELADAYQFSRQYQQEAIALRDYTELSKSIFQAERERQINQLQEEFSAKEKSKQIETLKQQNQLKAIEIERHNLQQHVTMLIGLVVALASTLLYLLYRKVQSANQKLKEANDQLAYQSLRDPLTGLYNRRSFQEQMEQRKVQVERRQLASFTTDGFILLDVDFFKHVNDHFGHAAGDAVLVEIANRLSKLTRNDDMVLRWGGEEFLILLRRVDIQALAAFTQRVLDIIANTPVIFGDQHIRITASAGFLTYPFANLNEQTMGWAKALQLADMALYLGKVHGRNRAYGLVQLNQPYADIAAQLETDLSLAIEQGKIQVMLIEGPQKTTTEL